MARQRFNLPAANRQVRTVLSDDQGNPMVQMSAGEYMVHNPDGSITVLRENRSIQLMCGLQWYPGMTDGQKIISVGVCELCRNPPYTFPLRNKPRHGLVSMDRARQCSGCGLLLCPRHQSRHGRQTFCPSCSRRYRLKNVLLRIFFRIEEE